VKRRQILFLSVIAIAILSLAVTIQFFRDSNPLAEWIFNFFNDWAPALSASAAIILIVTFLWNLRESRREKARSAIYDWVKYSIMILTSSKNTRDFDDIFRRGGTLLFDADILGKKFKDKLIEAINAIGERRAALYEGKLDEQRDEMAATFNTLSWLSECIIKD